MHWIIDHRIESEGATQRLLAAILAQGDLYTLVRKPPFADYLVGETGDDPIDLAIEGPCYASGSTSMEGVSIRHGWNPGYIDAPGIDQGLLHWGEAMLNHDLRTGRLDKIEPPAGPAFVRPVDDGKAFAGTIMDPLDFADFRDKALGIDSWTTLPPETMIAMSSAKAIVSEYRCLVASGRFVTGCRYKIGTLVRYVAGVPDEVAAFVNERTAEWNPRPAFIMDVAQTPDGLRVVETNSVSSAGFYALDMELYARAIRELGD